MGEFEGARSVDDRASQLLGAATSDHTVGTDDAFSSLRTELETLDGIAVRDRVPRFEQVNALLAAELAALDEV